MQAFLRPGGKKEMHCSASKQHLLREKENAASADAATIRQRDD